MSQWTSINFSISNPIPEPLPSTITDTRVTGLRNFLKGEVISIEDSDDGNEIMGNTVGAAIKNPNLPSLPETTPRGPGGIHPSRTQNINHKRSHPGSANSPENKSKRHHKNNNRIPLPGNPPPPTHNSNDTGPNRNVPIQVLIPTGPRARSPPKAPKAMTPKGKQPPAGPKSSKASRISPKDRYGAATNHAMGHHDNNQRRRYYVSTRKLPLFGDNSSSASTTNNIRFPNQLAALRSSPKANMLESVPMAKYVVPAKIHDTGTMLPTGSLQSYTNSSVPRLSPQPQRSQLDKNLTNSPNYSAKAIDKLALVMNYDANPSIANLTPKAVANSAFTTREPAPWDKYLIPGPGDSSSEVVKAGNISPKKYPQVHPARLNHFDPNYSTPSPEPDRYLSPRHYGRTDRDYTYKNSEIIGGNAQEIPATNKGRLMLEKMGYKSGVSLGKSGKEEGGFPVAAMKKGRGGIGADHREDGSQGTRFSKNLADITTTSKNDAIAINAAPLPEEQNNGRVVSRGSISQDEIIPQVGWTRGISQPLKVVVQDSRRVISTSSGGGTKERVVIIIDSDGEEESVQGVFLKGKGQGQKEDLEMQDLPEPQNPDVNDEIEVESIENVAEDNTQRTGGDVEMGDTHDCVADDHSHGSHSAQAELGLVRPQQSYSLDDTPALAAERHSPRDTKGKTPQDQNPDASKNSEEAVPRWSLPPPHHLPGLSRSTVPMQLFDLVIIERLEQTALLEIFGCIKSFEEGPHQLTGPAFNYILVRSFLKVRDMFMRDPLRDVDEEICAGIVKGEFVDFLAKVAREEVLGFESDPDMDGSLKNY